MPLLRLFTLAAGLMDFLTGLGLVFFPAQLLPLMRVATPAPDALVFLRFVGAFVGAVGATYLWAFLRNHRAYLRAVFELTIPFRLAAGAYSATAIALGWLPPVWLSVPATDFALVAAQLWLLRQPRLWSDENPRA
ncbi:hypothetical protein CMV30_09460 [Nibricoccus aquaticus]|uniref:Uncharacterized protein n=1 Tax=Nibricoccus aquaticus TaxID=2576891 RepID=A0A290Q6N6_9BACT|nr:hypothetical protein [Nibricoccus aquaticus]ATC64164.1 hypothetical protein CMV30_09460 [Nibricoccus aquaticus]